MCNDLFDDFGAEDFAFWGGFIETQLEGEKGNIIPDDPMTFEEMLKTGNEIFDQENDHEE